jgi:hypothetical protein
MFKKVGDTQPIICLNLDDMNPEQVKKAIEETKETVKTTEEANKEVEKS